MKKGDLNFKYQRKRIAKMKKLSPLCADYQSSAIGSCLLADKCKNATYGTPKKLLGACYGGTREEEREKRKRPGWFSEN